MISLYATQSPKKSTAGFSKVLCSPTENWIVNNIDKNIIYENYENGDTLKVKRVLFHENYIPKKSCFKTIFVVASDLGHSLRRIFSKMFDDEFLVNYSLIGLKKKAFTKLMYVSCIIDSLRMHIKYKTGMDQEIDELPLGFWLAHAPFRLSKKLKLANIMKLTTNIVHQIVKIPRCLFFS